MNTTLRNVDLVLILRRQLGNMIRLYAVEETASHRK